MPLLFAGLIDKPNGRKPRGKPVGPLRRSSRLYVTLDVSRNECYHILVIVSFRDKKTETFAAGGRVKAFTGIERPTRLKLDRLDAATAISDLSALPGNRFEALKGNRKGQYSIRINDQWRICFEWPPGATGPHNVEIVDYH